MPSVALRHAWLGTAGSGRNDSKLAGTKQLIDRKIGWWLPLAATLCSAVAFDKDFIAARSWHSPSSHFPVWLVLAAVALVWQVPSLAIVQARNKPQLTTDGWFVSVRQAYAFWLVLSVCGSELYDVIAKLEAR